MSNQARTRLLVPVVTLLVLLGAFTSAQAPVPDVAQAGPQIGETVPAFSLVDQFGQHHDLETLMGPKGL